MNQKNEKFPNNFFIVCIRKFKKNMEPNQHQIKDNCDLWEPTAKIARANQGYENYNLSIRRL